MKNNNDTELSQNYFLEYSKDYINYLKKNQIDTSKSVNCYLTPWAETPGYANLLLKVNYFKYYLKNIFIRSKYFFATINCFSYVKIDFANKKEYENIIITWAKKNDFDTEGNYIDKYFKTSNKDTKTTLWYLVYLDKDIPKINKSNIKLIYKSDLSTITKAKKFIFFLFKEIYRSKFSVNKFFHYINSLTFFGNKLFNFILEDYDNVKFKKIIMPYEGQPFQNIIFKKFKIFNSSISMVGYSHSALLPLPLNMFFREGAPDKLNVSGETQKKYLETNLSWPPDAIKIIPSFRYRKNDKDNIDGFVFFPYFINSVNKIVREFDFFLKNSKVSSLNQLIVRNHPSKLNSKKHIKLSKLLNKLIIAHKDKFSNNGKKLSVFIGATTSIILALEKKIDVIHICENPVFELYDDNYWDSLQVQKLTSNLFIYKLNKFEKYIKFGDKNFNLETFF